MSGRTVIFDFPSLNFDTTDMDVLASNLTVEDNKVYIDLDLRETSSTIFDWDEGTEDLGGTDPGLSPSAVTAPTPGYGASPAAVAGGLLYTDI
jgi:hypothetical protein